MYKAAGPCLINPPVLPPVFTCLRWTIVNRHRKARSFLFINPRTFVAYTNTMEQHAAALQELYNRVPRRHSADNVKEINNILDEYENILSTIEGLNAWYEKNTAAFYPSLDG